MKKCRRIMSMLLVIAMLLVALPISSITAFAASGVYGDLTWTLTDEGVLTISGEGEMQNSYYDQSDIPWRNYSESIVSLIVNSGITSIGKYVFGFCDNLVSVALPQSITDIGDFAFYECSSLQNIKLPNNVSRIGECAFSGCTSITEINIPDSVIEIGGYAFYSCTALSDVRLSNGMDYVDGFAGCESLQSIVIPDGVSFISYVAFENCASLKSIEIPDTVSYIGDYSFDGCDSLKYVYFGGTAAAWGDLQSNYFNKPLVQADKIYNCNTHTHKWDSAWTVKGDYHWHECIGDSCYLLDNYIKEGYSQHSYGEWVTKVEETCTSNGLKERTCTYCGHKEEKTVYSSGHVVAYIPKTAPSCTEPGNIEHYACTECDALFKDSKANVIIENHDSVIIKATGHIAETEWYSDDESHWNECTCGKKMNISDHTFGEWVKDYDSKVRTCTKCGYSESTDILAYRIAGGSRTETAAVISECGFETAENVVIASGDNYADALAGVSLAYALDAPILLVRNNKLDSATTAEIRRLGATKAYILGGEIAVSNSVVTQLKNLGCSVSRIAGKTRFDTAVQIAKCLETISGKPKEVYFAYSHNYPDALAISGIAAIKGSPVLYINADGKLDNATKEYVSKCGASYATILGGHVAISAAAEGNIQKAGIKNVSRIYGKSRYDTCLKINEAYANILTGDAICVATGTNYPDALAGGVFAALTKSPMLLVGSTVTSEQNDFTYDKMPANIYIFGGTGAVSDEVAYDLLYCTAPGENRTVNYTIDIDYETFDVKEENGVKTIYGIYNEDAKMTIEHFDVGYAENMNSIISSEQIKGYTTFSSSELPYNYTGKSISFQDGNNWDSTVTQIHCISDGHGGCFVIRTYCIVEAMEGFGAMFDYMLSTFKIVD